MVVNFAIDTLGVLRLEARAVIANGRGNGALRKIGAVQEGVLRRSFVRNGQHHDQVLWGILADDWRLQRLAHRRRGHAPRDLRQREQHDAGDAERRLVGRGRDQVLHGWRS